MYRRLETEGLIGVFPPLFPCLFENKGYMGQFSGGRLNY